VPRRSEDRLALRRWAAALALALLAVPPPADARRRKRADAGREPNEEAANLDALGKAAYGKEQYEDAIAAFEAAWEADPLPRFLFNLGRCHERAGHLARAAHYFQRYLREAPDAADAGKVEALVKVLRVKLKKQFGEVRVATRPAGALVQVTGGDESAEGLSPFSEWVPFGEYSLAIRLEGYLPHQRTIVVKPRSPIDLRLRLRREGGEVEEVGDGEDGEDGWGGDDEGFEDAGEPGGAPPPPGGGTHWPSTAAISLGAGLLAAGALVGLLAYQDVTERDGLVQESLTGDVRLAQVREQDAAARSKALVANVLFGAGALSAVAGAVLWLSSHEAAPAAASLAPVPGGGVVVVAGTL